MLKKNIAIVFILTLIAKGLGFFRDIALVSQCGASSQTDIFFAVTNLVETIICLFGIQALFSSSTKLFSEVQDDSQTRSRFFSSFSIAVSLITIPLAIIIAFAGEFWVQLLYPGFNSGFRQTTALFLTFFAVNIPVLAFLRSYNSVLGLHGSFYLQNLVPVISNLIIISTIFIVNKENVTFALLVGTTLMNIAFLIIQGIMLKRIGYYFITPTKSNLGDVVKRVSKLTGPLVLVTMSNSLFMMYTQYLASSCQQGTVTLLALGSNLVFFSIGLIFVSVLSVAFPTMATLFHNNKIDELKILLKKIIDLALVVFIPVSIFFILNANIVVKGIFFRKNFTPENAALLSEIIKVLGFAIVPMVFNLIFNNLLQTYGKNSKVAIGALIAFVFSIAIAFICFKFKGGYGIAWGMTSYHIILAITLGFLAEREIALKPMRVILTYGLFWLLLSLGIIELFNLIPIDIICNYFNILISDSLVYPVALAFRGSGLIAVYLIILCFYKFVLRQRFLFKKD